jgi:hypothetical protein
MNSKRAKELNMEKMEISFTAWLLFSGDDAYKQFAWVPGIYAIAYSDEDISGKDFDYIKEIVYFGMTNSKNGLYGRLKQFNNTITSKHAQHGGADRFIFNLDKEDKNWREKLYVSTMPFIHFDVTSNLPRDLNLMGDVAKQEFSCFAKYVERFNKMPRFNDKENSPKKEKKSKAICEKDKIK